MPIEKTLSIIKPDATKRNLVGKIVDTFETANLRVVAQKRVKWTLEQAKKFYEIHSEKNFFQDLITYMCSGPIVLQVLEGENAVLKNREIMGATNPENAKSNTIRGKWGVSIEENSVHGSDSVENAKNEIALCFKEDEIIG